MLPPALSSVLLPLLAVGAAAYKNAIPDGQVAFGVWFDGTTDISGNDTTARVNDRVGFNVAAFQGWQMLPPVPAPQYAPLQNADGTVNFDLINEGTNASFFLTVYPQSFNVTDADITALANQCNEILALGRNVFVRFGPEMNGAWFVYGQQPTAFITLWKRVYTIMNSVAPAVAMVWAPNYDGPNAGTPYDPYWPGADYVDWVGLSLYWKGYVADWPWKVNKAAPANYVAQIIDAQGPEGGSTSFYQAYAVAYNKPFVISETAASFNEYVVNSNGTKTAIDPGPGEVTLKMSFWDTFLFNQTFIEKYPLFKLVFAFEIYKVEDNVGRNFPALTDPTLDSFVQGLQAMDRLGLLAWAASTSDVTTTSATSAAAATVTTKKSGAMMSRGLAGVLCAAMLMLMVL